MIRFLSKLFVFLCSNRPWGLTALCLASYCSSRRLVEYFLAMKVDPNETDRPNSTDQYFQNLAADHPHKIQMKEMHSRVAQDMGMFHTPLQILIKNDAVELVDLMVKSAVDIDVNAEEAYTKRTALHLAAERSSIEVERRETVLVDVELFIHLDDSSSGRT